MAGVGGLEPPHDRVKVYCLTSLATPQFMVEREGFEPPNPKELSYSQPRLATSLSLQNMVLDIGLEPTTY